MFVIILLGLSSFGLGRLSVTENNHIPVTLCKDKYTQQTYDTARLTTNVINNKKNIVKGQYVASKTGKAYHLPWCSGAKRIKEKNKIWFNTKTDAENAGYRPASNCKGI